MYSIFNLNKSLSILRKVPRLNARTRNHVAKPAVRVKRAKKRGEVKVRCPVRSITRVETKYITPSNPLRISEEDPEIFFRYN